MNINDTLTYDSVESLDDQERGDLDRELASRSMCRVDHGGGYTIGWMFDKRGQRLDDPVIGDQPE